MSAAISTSGQRAVVGEVRKLFRISAKSIWFSYDVSPDGQRLLVNVPLSEENPQPVMLVQIWTEGLGR